MATGPPNLMMSTTRELRYQKNKNKNKNGEWATKLDDVYNERIAVPK